MWYLTVAGSLPLSTGTRPPHASLPPCLDVIRERSISSTISIEPRQFVVLLHLSLMMALGCMNIVDCTSVLQSFHVFHQANGSLLQMSRSSRALETSSWRFLLPHSASTPSLLPPAPPLRPSLPYLHCFLLFHVYSSGVGSNKLYSIALSCVY